MIEAKPADVEMHDLRLSEDFPELKAFAQKYDLDNPEMTQGEHSHVPFPVILIKEAAKWKQNHEGVLP